EHKSRREVLAAIKSVPSTAELLSTHEGHFDHELDLEVAVYGRNYNGKKVGPYVSLLTYDPGEAIIKEGEWGGNSFFIMVSGEADVFIESQDPPGPLKVATLKPGMQFGEMSVLAGVPRNATIMPPPGGSVSVLEIQRPALRLFRKLDRFGNALDQTYRLHGRSSALDRLKATLQLPDDVIAGLKSVSTFRVFTKNHVLVRQGGLVDKIYLILTGWAQRTSERGKSQPLEDFLGEGYCIGLEGALRDVTWPFTATLLDRGEVLEMSITKIRQNPGLRSALTEVLSKLSAPEMQTQYRRYSPPVVEKVRSAQSALIETGLVDGTNLLVMDMALCVRCGNCSLACHKVHGQSRLLRRGIHVTRLRSARLGAVQSILSPEVCMHCQDPECLTGCPTGAIGRFKGGQIDIEPKTCIGCGDCATQCPYDAISMVPRKPKTPQGKPSLTGRLRQLLRLSPDPLPPAVEQTDDLVAVKCNLCDGTTLNPKGASRPAYSCEENCPTGALARIQPARYFDEIGEIKGLLRIDETHAIGKNIHKSDPPRRLMHIVGLLVVILSTAGALTLLGTYGLGVPIVSFLNMRWITGLVGLVAIAGVMIYPARKQIYLRRAGPLRYWMLSHTYLGTIAAIMIFLHGGRSSGGVITTALMIAFDLTILTGVVGILFYFFIPRLLTKIEGTPLLIDDLKARSEELKEEIAHLQSATREPAQSTIKRRILPRFLKARYVVSHYFRHDSLDSEITRAKRKLRKHIESIPAGPDREKTERAVELAATSARVDALVYLHRLLKLWLAPHIVFTSLMLALMAVHIVQVIYYAAR
ncbi:MAG TPA: cyclic nucleotide-binding domain-containing protein, partial [Blastocatellia bacterium]